MAELSTTAFNDQIQGSQILRTLKVEQATQPILGTVPVLKIKNINAMKWEGRGNGLNMLVKPELGSAMIWNINNVMLRLNITSTLGDADKTKLQENLDSNADLSNFAIEDGKLVLTYIFQPWQLKTETKDNIAGALGYEGYKLESFTFFPEAEDFEDLRWLVGLVNPSLKEAYGCELDMSEFDNSTVIDTRS